MPTIAGGILLAVVVLLAVCVLLGTAFGLLSTIGGAIRFRSKGGRWPKPLPAPIEDDEA